VNAIIVDTGPLVAFLNRRDGHHRWVRDLLDSIEPPLLTCEAVVSEACLLLRDLGGGQDAVLELLARDIVRTEFELAGEVGPVRGLMKKFANVPMSLADACLVRMTELVPRSKVVTLDGDFGIYRRNKRQMVPTIIPPATRRR
jgi:predicted nucleic acid-binding protein